MPNLVIRTRLIHWFPRLNQGTFQQLVAGIEQQKGEPHASIFTYSYEIARHRPPHHSPCRRRSSRRRRAHLMKVQQQIVAQQNQNQVGQNIPGAHRSRSASLERRVDWPRAGGRP